MFDAQMEFRKGILFIRLTGELNNKTINDFRMKVKEVVIRAGIRYLVLNVNNVNSVTNEGVKEIKSLKKVMKKLDGEFYLFGGSIKKLKGLVNLENELNVFERGVI